MDKYKEYIEYYKEYITEFDYKNMIFCEDEHDDLLKKIYFLYDNDEKRLKINFEYELEKYKIDVKLLNYISFRTKNLRICKLKNIAEENDSQLALSYVSEEIEEEYLIKKLDELKNKILNNPKIRLRTLLLK